MANQETKTIIQVKNLIAGYNGNIVLNDISFDVKKGSVFVILGGSGCGKSTLLKHMIGLYDPISGEVLIQGEDIVQSRGKARNEILRGIGVMYQSGAMFGSMTVLENIKLVLKEFTNLPEEAMNIIGMMKLRLVGLSAAANKMPSELSGGMLKRAAIARAMSLDPDVLFLDEPSAGLDPVTSAQLDELITDLSRTLGITFVIVTHELQSIFAIADEVLMLDAISKKVIASGNPKDLKESSNDIWVSQFFNRSAEPYNH